MTTAITDFDGMSSGGGRIAPAFRRATREKTTRVKTPRKKPGAFEDGHWTDTCLLLGLAGTSIMIGILMAMVIPAVLTHLPVLAAFGACKLAICGTPLAPVLDGFAKAAATVAALKIGSVSVGTTLGTISHQFSYTKTRRKLTQFLKNRIGHLFMPA